MNTLETSYKMNPLWAKLPKTIGLAADVSADDAMNFGLDHSTMAFNKLPTMFDESNTLDASQTSTEGAIIHASSILAKAGCDEFRLFCSFSKFADLLRGQGVRVMICEQVADGIEFQGVEMFTCVGPTVIMPDRSCPDDVMYALTLDTWHLDGERNLTCSNLKHNLLIKVS